MSAPGLGIPLAAIDAAKPKRRGRRLWRPRVSTAETQFLRALRGVARHIGDIVEGLADAEQLPTLTQVLAAYSKALTPWAKATAHRMLGEVNGSNKRMWRSLGTEMSKQLRTDLMTAPVAELMHKLAQEQVALIQSLPIEAAQRVAELTREGLINSERANVVRAEILRTGEVTASRATLIARTETARSTSVLTEARSLAAGASHYYWRTADDSDVRPGHKAMAGKVCAWNDPPAVNENGRIMHHHPGRIWNCRCYAEPIIDEG